MIVPLTGKVTGVDIGMFTEVYPIVVLTLITPASYDIESRAAVISDVLARTVISVANDIVVDGLVDVDADVCAATMITLESIPAMTSSEEALPFG